MERVTLLLLCLRVAVASPPAISKTFRTDYVYNAKTDAFYKFHIDEANFHHAKEICLLENAKLFTPVHEWDFRQLHAMVKSYPDINDIWMGDDGQTHHEDDANIFELGAKPTSDSEYDYYSDEGEEKCEVVNKFGDVRSSCCKCNSLTRPFICKVEAKDAFYDENCEVYDSGYEYVASVGSCYKIPRIALTWNAAYAACHGVGSHLVVLNSEGEHQAVVNIMKKSEPVPRSHHSYYLIAGFRTKGESRDFVTIFNQTLEEAGYAQWSEYEPNNFNQNEYCGSLFKEDGKLNDLNCNDRYGFICEKEKRI